MPRAATFPCRAGWSRSRWKTHGALPCRLHQQGQVIGRDAHLLYVRFECDNQMIALRPHLVRLINAPDRY
jgi:hypothetical protein